MPLGMHEMQAAGLAMPAGRPTARTLAPSDKHRQRRAGEADAGARGRDPRSQTAARARRAEPPNARRRQKQRRAARL